MGADLLVLHEASPHCIQRLQLLHLSLPLHHLESGRREGGREGGRDGGRRGGGRKEGGGD